MVRPVEYGKSIDRWIDIAPNRIGPRNMALQDSAFRPAGQQDERQVIGGHAVRAGRNQRGEGLRAHEIVHDFDTVFAKSGRLIHLDFLFYSGAFRPSGGRLRSSVLWLFHAIRHNSNNLAFPLPQRRHDRKSLNPSSLRS